MSDVAVANRMLVTLRREDIGLFDPRRPDSRNSGVVTEGTILVFTDVGYFIDRVNSFLENPIKETYSHYIYEHEATIYEVQIQTLFGSLLLGAAATWWTCEMSSAERRNLRSKGLAKVLDALRTRFAKKWVDYSEEADYYDSSTIINEDESVNGEHIGLTITEFDNDGESLPRWILNTIRDRRAEVEGWDWHEISTWHPYIYDAPPEVVSVVPFPLPDMSLSQYMRHIEEALHDIARTLDLI